MSTTGADDVAFEILVADLSASVDISIATTVGASGDVTLLNVSVNVAAGVQSTSESLSTIILRRRVGSFVEVDTVATTAGAADDVKY
jgi:predicted tellurium resistance membrane protein TerC